MGSMSHTFEVVITAIVIAASAGLFGYWFRYTCLLILNAKTACDYAGDVIKAHQLSFPAIRATLGQAGSIDLEALHSALDRDYEKLTRLLKEGENAQLSIETQMLEARYKMMDVWCRATQSLSPTAARRTLDEMCATVAYLANVVGERNAGIESAAWG